MGDAAPKGPVPSVPLLDAGAVVRLEPARPRAVVLDTDPDEDPVAIPALAGGITAGDTREEAIAHAAGAIAIYPLSLRDDGPPIPTEDVETATVPVPMPR